MEIEKVNIKEDKNFHLKTIVQFIVIILFICSLLFILSNKWNYYKNVYIFMCKFINFCFEMIELFIYIVF